MEMNSFLRLYIIVQGVSYVTLFSSQDKGTEGRQMASVRGMAQVLLTPIKERIPSLIELEINPLFLFIRNFLTIFTVRGL